MTTERKFLVAHKATQASFVLMALWCLAGPFVQQFRTAWILALCLTGLTTAVLVHVSFKLVDKLNKEAGQ